MPVMAKRSGEPVSRVRRVARAFGLGAAVFGLIVEGYAVVVAVAMAIVMGWLGLLMLGALVSILALGIATIRTTSRLAAALRLSIAITVAYPAMAVYGLAVLALWFIVSSVGLLVYAWRTPRERG